jgi:iron(III) transport system substrate-binding protein
MLAVRLSPFVPRHTLWRGPAFGAWKTGALAIAALVIATACTGSTTTSPFASDGTASSLPSVAAGSAGPSGGDAKAEWAQVLAAAKKEGTVVVWGPPGDSFRAALKTAFEVAYPDITVEFNAAGGDATAARVLGERDAGQYLADLIVGGGTDGFLTYAPKGALDPIRPALILPEVTDDSKWAGGFDAGWIDKAHEHVYAFVGTNPPPGYINRTEIPAGELTSADDLLDPKWKGKIAMIDPRNPSAGSRTLASLMLAKDEAFLREFLTVQQPVLTTDYRQLGEWLVRGRYPIVLALIPSTLLDFEGQGLVLDNIEPIVDAKWSGYTSALGNTYLLSKAPHPNATKIFINWLLSAEGQTAFSKNTRYNSRRLDVPVADPKQAADPTREYINPQKEGPHAANLQAVGIAKELLN